MTREMQIKTLMRCCFSPIVLTKIQKLWSLLSISLLSYVSYEETYAHTLLVGMKNYVSRKGKNLATFNKTTHSLTFDLAILLLNIIPQHAYMHKVIHCSSIYNCKKLETTYMSTIWSQLKKLLYLQAMEYYIAVTKNKDGL